jgi:hypothetical protein
MTSYSVVKNRLRVSENKVLGKIFEPTQVTVTKGGRKLYSPNSSLGIVTVIK